MSKVFFSCPNFTVLLVTNGPVIVTAAPIVKRFEGQTVDMLKFWAQSRFSGPIVVEELRRFQHEDTGTGGYIPAKRQGPCSKFVKDRRG